MKFSLRSRFLSLAAAAMLSAAAASPALAGLVTVDAALNSSGGGTGITALELTQGQQFTLTSSLLDLWSAGPMRGSLLKRDPGAKSVSDVRTSYDTRANANGLVGMLYAQDGDDSGAAAGTLLGRAFVGYDSGGFIAPYASLVGRIGDGAFFLIGALYSGIASESGTLKLYFWDENAADNSGTLNVDAQLDVVGALPEPKSAALVAAALGALALFTRRRQQR